MPGLASRGEVFRCFKEGQAEKPKRRTRDQPGDEAGEERAVRCRACGHPITSRRQEIEVEGSHVHTFFNPAGILFEIGCFDQASGCVITGVPTSEFAWFQGTRWRYAMCGECRRHLGWQFLAPAGARFFGLILNRLTEEPASPRP